MKRESKKVYMGNVEVKDFDVKQCIDNNESLIITHEGDQMTLTPEELITKRMSMSRIFENKNKFKGGRDYRLFGYEWIPDEVEL